MWCLRGVQRDKVRALRSMIPVTEQVAIHTLQRHNWNIEHACNSYLQKQQKNTIRNELDNLFMRYAHNFEKINDEGIERLLNDLNLNANSIYVLLLAWKFKAKMQWVFTREEFYQGMNALQVDSISKLKQKLPLVEQELNDIEKMREFYLFVFEYAKEPNQRLLDVNMAIAYWNIVLKKHFVYLDDWCMFLKETKKTVISKDSWNLLFDFALHAEEHISNYDAEGAWPVLLDEFVEWFKQKQQNLTLNTKVDDDAIMQEL